MAEPGEALSSREQEIIRLVATGATNRMIAQQLSISPNTVKVHLRNIFTKLEISSRTEATVVAIQEGWVGIDTPDSATADVQDKADTEPEPAEEQFTLDWSLVVPGFSVRKKLCLLASLVAVVVLTVVTWPRSYLPAAGSCDNEFTADCGVESSDLELGVPESVWVSGAPLPESRGRFALVTLDGLLYAIGGETPAGVTGSTAIYDPDQDQWRTAAEKPTPAANLAAVALDGVIYAIGGSDAEGLPMNVVERYDPESNSWSQVESLPKALVAHGAVTNDEQIYVVGGNDGSRYVGSLYAFNPTTGGWRVLTDMPTTRGFAAVAMLNQYVYVMGGYDGQREYAVCERYVLQDDVWETCQPMTTPRGGARAAAVAGQIYVVGGGWESFVTFSERYSPNADVWHNVETPVLLAGGEWLNLGLATLGTRIFAVGGWQRDRYLNLNQAYETLPNRLYLPATTGGGN